MIFASLILERPPLEMAELPAALAEWVRDAGALAAFGLVIFLLAFLLQQRWSGMKWQTRDFLFAGLTVAAFATYALFGVMIAVQGTRQIPIGPAAPGQSPPTITAYTSLQILLLTLAGALAVLAVCLPILLGIFGALKWRRIWALAILSIKEARAKGILWICLIIPLIYLFADWYLLSPKPEEQIRQRVKIAYFALSILFVVTAVLLGSFSIPTDVRNQTIHTIVTKPVDRYEIVLGRFVGYALLLGVEVLVLTGLSLFYVSRGITPEASVESYRARRPLFAKRLVFWTRGEIREQGESAGREWDYRSYISNQIPGSPRQYALWEFDRLPSSLANREGTVPVEWTLDIFRTTKGEERDQGVFCTFLFALGTKEVPEVERAKDAYLADRVEKFAEIDRVLREMKVNDRDKEAQRAKLNEEAIQSLIDKHHVYVSAGTLVTDYHTQKLDLPAALFRKLYAEQDKNAPAPAMKVLVTLEPSSGPQMLGVARTDLYVLAGDGTFWANFIKGAVGLWYSACLVLVIALACSTYLSGVISLLTTLFLCGAGLFLEYIREVAFGTLVGGGPGESMLRLFNRQAATTELDRTSSAVSGFLFVDDLFRWYLRRVLNFIPDVTRYDLTVFVANGYDISWSQVLFADTLVPLLGYIVPCGVLAYYLMNSREIANPT